jgi:hypothetical protein
LPPTIRAKPSDNTFQVNGGATPKIAATITPEHVDCVADAIIAAAAPLFDDFEVARFVALAAIEASAEYREGLDQLAELTPRSSASKRPSAEPWPSRTSGPRRPLSFVIGSQSLRPGYERQSHT